MSDKTEEWLSALMDNELVDFDRNVEQLRADDELKGRWMRYHLIRDVVSGHLPERMDGGFDLAARVSAALESEPVILAPRRFQPRQLMKQAAGLAIAATVSAVAIIGIQNPEASREAPAPLASAEPAAGVVTLRPGKQGLDVQLKGQGAALAALPAPRVADNGVRMVSAPVRVTGAPLPAMSASASKFNGYLLNHNEYSISSNMQGMLPYMRIVSATQNKPVLVRLTNEK